MNFVLIFPYYIKWHYGRAISDLTRLWKNFLSFIYHFFSIPLLVSNLFSPWRRMSDEHRAGESFGDMMFTLIFNTIMRGVGVVIRIIFIFTGLVGLLVTTVVGICAFVVWYLIPVILVYLVVSGIRQL